MLCEVRVPQRHSERVYIRGWAESRHIMRPNVRAPQRSSPTSGDEYGAEAAIQSIQLLCDSKTQKRHKHRPGLYAQTCTGSAVADTDTFITLTLLPPSVGERGKGLIFIELACERKRRAHVQCFTKKKRHPLQNQTIQPSI